MLLMLILDGVKGRHNGLKMDQDNYTSAKWIKMQTNKMNPDTNK